LGRFLIVRGLRTDLSPRSRRQPHVEELFLRPIEEGIIMKGFLAVIVLLVVCVAAFGFYQGWFTMSTDNTDHKSNVTFSVDQDKFKADEEKAKEKVQDLGHKVKEKTGDRTDKVEEKERRP
jgi:hypothetical protein